MLDWVQQLHRWHSVQSGATFGILFAESLVALLRQPQSKPVVVQFFVAGTVVLAAALDAFDAARLLLAVGAGLPSSTRSAGRGALPPVADRWIGW